MKKIWLLGRTNVWKSTLFNKLIGNHRAIITDIAGTTREFLVDEIVLWSQYYEITDAPWLDTFEQEIPFLEHIIQESDLLLFVVDGKQEIWKNDQHIKQMIMKANKMHQTVLLVNKLDGKVYSDEVFSLLAEWYQLWFEHVVALSAEQAEWIESVRDMIQELIPDDQSWTIDTDQSYIPLAILWKPNAWKSTLINALSGEWIATVSDTPWTTLDYLTTMVTYRWSVFKVFDTAWIRKKWKTVWLERIAFEKTKAMIQYVKPVVVFMIDLEEWFTKRDGTLLAEIEQFGVPILLAFNKIDCFSKDESRYRVAMILKKNSFLEHMQRVLISAQETLWLDAVCKEVIALHKKWNSRISTWLLNKVLTKAWLLSPPRFPKNKICKWKYISQVSVAPPTFMLSVNNKEYANFSFQARIKNVLRKECNLWWVPLRLSFNSKIDTNPYLSD